MTVKFLLDSDGQPLLSNIPAAVPPSQEQNDEFDSSKDDDEEEEWILYSPELDIAVEEAVFLRALNTFTGTTAQQRTGKVTNRRFYVENLPDLTQSQFCSFDEDDAPSLCASSVSSSSSSLSSYSSSRVRFAEPLVTEVRLRPRTKPEERTALFYSFDEIQR